MKKMVLLSLLLFVPLCASQRVTDSADNALQKYLKEAAATTDNVEKSALNHKAAIAQRWYNKYASLPDTVSPVQSAQSRSWLSTMLTFPFNHPRKTIALALLAYCVNKARHEDNRGKYDALWDHLKEEYDTAVNWYKYPAWTAFICYAGYGSGLLLQNLLVDGFNGVQEDGKNLGIAALHNAWKKVRSSLPWPFGKKEEKSADEIVYRGVSYIPAPADRGDSKRGGRS